VSVTRDYDVTVDEGIPVRLYSGATFYVLTQDEADYLDERIKLYGEQNHFTNISDIQDIDKMVIFELLIHRWSLWLSKGVDYWNDTISQREVSERVNNTSRELRQIKAVLGIDKKTRDRTHGDDSIPAYLDALRMRAREFGIMRNAQFDHVITAFQRISAFLGYHDRCDDQERKEFNVTVEDLIEVIRDEVASFEAIDAEFRQSNQKLWIRKQ
jgi:hypothetical protein